MIRNPKSQPMKHAIQSNIFISYHWRDQSILERLLSHLKPLQSRGKINNIWHRGMIVVGADIFLAQLQGLERSGLFIPLLSHDYFDDRDCCTELDIAFGLFREKEINIQPVVVRPCLWQEYSKLNIFRGLPAQELTLSSREWTSEDEPYALTAKGIKEALGNPQFRSANFNLVAKIQEFRLKEYTDGYPVQEPRPEELSNFRRSLLRRLEMIDEENYWNPDEVVPLDVEVEVKRNSSPRRGVSSLMKTIIKNSTVNTFLLVGDPDSGKSVALRELCKYFLRKSRRDDNRIPIFVNLRDWYNVGQWTKSSPPTPLQLEEFIMGTLLESKSTVLTEFVKKHFRALYRRGRFLFFLDSFDETPAVIDSPEGSWLIDSLSETIYQFCHECNCRVIMASREFKKPSEKYRAELFLRIYPLTDEKFSKSLELSGISREVILQLLDAFHLRALLKNPFLLSLIKDYLRNNENKLPTNQLSLFEDSIGKRLNLEELELDQVTSLEQITETSKIIATSIFSDPHYGFSISLDDLNRKASGQSLNHTVSILWRRKLARVGNGRFSFIHRKFHEYFIALHFKDHPEFLPIADIPRDAKHRDALVVYCSIAEEKIAEAIARYCWQQMQKVNYRAAPPESIMDESYRRYILPEIISAYKQENKIWLHVSGAGLLKQAKFKEFHDDYLKRHFLDDTIVLDSAYRMALNCLRFLADAFRTRKEVLQNIQPNLREFVADNLFSSGNLIFKKNLLEAVALLDREAAEDVITDLLRLFDRTLNSYLLEALDDSIRYLKDLSPDFLHFLFSHYKEKQPFMGRNSNREQIKAFRLSRQLAPVGHFLTVAKWEKKISFWLFILFSLFSIQSCFVFLSEKTPEEASWDWVKYVVLTFLLFLMARRTPITVFAFGRKYSSQKVRGGLLLRQLFTLVRLLSKKETYRNVYRWVKSIIDLLVAAGANSLTASKKTTDKSNPSEVPKEEAAKVSKAGLSHRKKLIVWVNGLFRKEHYLLLFRNFAEGMANAGRALFRPFLGERKKAAEPATPQVDQEEKTETGQDSKTQSNLSASTQSVLLRMVRSVINWPGRVLGWMTVQSNWLWSEVWLQWKRSVLARIAILYTALILLQWLANLSAKIVGGGEIIRTLIQQWLMTGVIFIIALREVWVVARRSRRYRKDKRILTKIKKEHPNTMDRPTIAKYFFLFETVKYRTLFVMYLRDNSITTSGEWPRNYLPNIGDDEASGILASLEERWRGLSK